MKGITQSDVFNAWSEGLRVGYLAGWTNRGEDRYPPEVVFPPEDQPAE